MAVCGAGGDRRKRSGARRHRSACGGPLVLSGSCALRARSGGAAGGAAALRLRPLPHPRALSRQRRRARAAPRAMHCELVIPGLLAAPSAARLPAAELLIARGRCTSDASRGLEDWLHDAFELGEEPLAAGALTLLAGGGEPAGYSWSRADPVHLRLMRDRLVLVPAAALHITSGEADALCTALNRHFGERLALQVIDAERWVARTPPEFVLGPTPPLALAGRDVALAMPANAALHQLLNEAQMVLHDHPVNEAREARGEPEINSIWLWGAGRIATIDAPRWHSVSAAEPLALGLA